MLFKKNNSTQTSGSAFAERIEKAKMIKFELELIKIVDCFPDGHGSFDSNLVSFKMKSLEQAFFLLQLVGRKSVPQTRYSQKLACTSKIEHTDARTVSISPICD